MHASPPGPSGDPFIGNARRYADDPFAFMDACANAYGDVIRVDLGPRRTYMLTHPADVERVLVSEAGRYRKVDFGDRAIHDLLGDGLLLSEGETWRRQRRLANPAFDARRVAALAEPMAIQAESAVADWDDGDVIDVQLAMARLTVRIIVTAMFGDELDDDTVERIQERLEPLGERFEPDPRRILIPDWVPTRENRAFDRAIRDLEAVIDAIVERRRGTEYDPSVDPAGEAGTAVAGPEGDPDGPMPMDLLSVLLRARDRGEQTDATVRDELMTMLLAGHDTTALTLTYAFYLLSNAPGVRERLEQEVDDALVATGDRSDARDGSGPPRPTPDTVRELPFTRRVVDEAMRLYPPVYTMFREPSVDVKHGGYRLPAGSVLMLPQWVIHRSPRWYETPDAFDPDRWLPERSRDRPRFAFFPFGGGPRHCIGRQLSLLEATLILATVCSRFRLEYEGPALSLRGSLTMHPDHSMPVRVHQRH